MKDSPYLYSLRFCVEPGFREEERLTALVDFCLEAGVGDVMFFINPEELNRGHLTVPDTGRWLDVIKRGKEMLEPHGVTASINPWNTLLHCDRGRTLREEQRFRTMMDAYGNRAGAVACPLCPQWRDYIAEMYALYAGLRPRMLWVEDDFRLHNHAPLVWGGCFCDAHMEVYSQRAGRKLDRRDFARAILQPGEPHPYRKIWLDVARETMAELAERIGGAVRRVSPDTGVGLMSSTPWVHCAEGRDWRGVARGLSGGGPFIHRIHLPAYTEETSQNYLKNLCAVSRLSRAFTPEPAVVLPELENFPASRFSTSRSFTRFQLETSLLLEAGGMTLNLFDMMGNGILAREGYAGVLRESKDFLSALKALGLRPDRQRGVVIPVSSKSVCTLRTRCGESMEELYPREYFWAVLLTCFGISNRIVEEGDPAGGVVAVSGQYLRNLDETAIRSLFDTNFVMLEAEAAYTLLDMGYGELAGIEDAEWHTQDTGYQAYEQVTDGRRYGGLEQARLSAQSAAGDYLRVRYGGKHRVITAVMDPTGAVLGPGMTVYKGSVLVLPYGRFESLQSHLTPIRQALTQGVLMELDGERRPVFAVGDPYVAVFEYELNGRRALLLINASRDDLPEVKLYAPRWGGPVLEMNRRDIAPVKAAVRREGERLILESGLAALEVKVLLTDKEALS